MFKGSAGYFAGVFKALMRFRPISLRVHLDDDVIETDAMFVIAQNTPYCGGGQLMAPDADLHDGKLDIVLVTPVNRIELLRTFPKVYDGSHIKHPAFHIYRSSTLRIESDAPVRKLLDGDVVGMQPLDSSVIQGGLKVVLPSS